jgi:hypothetical protein
MANVCVLMVLGIGLGCTGGGNTAVIDATCDMKRVELPADWRSECIDGNGHLRTSLEGKKRQACLSVAANNRVRKQRCEAKP